MLIVIDMQEDFVNGALGTPEAQTIVPNVRKMIEKENGKIFFTLDKHGFDYLNTFEGKNLPIPHCIKNTSGAGIVDELKSIITKKYRNVRFIDKNTFGSEILADYIKNEIENNDHDIHMVGVCTDICVVTNALYLRMMFPNERIIVHSDCCAGTTPEKHNAALEVMKSCMIEVV